MDNRLILIGLICVAAGFYLQYTGKIDLLSSLNDLPTKIEQVTADPIQFIQSNMGIIAGGLTVVTVAYGAVSSLINKIRSDANKIKEEQAKTVQISNDYLKLSKEKEAADAALTGKIEEIETLKQTYSSSEETIKKLRGQIVQLQKEKAELNRIMQYIDDKVTLEPKTSVIP